MRIGSVKFFKRLILTVVALMILIPVSISIGLGVEVHQRGQEIGRLSGELETVSNELLETQLSNEKILATNEKIAQGLRQDSPTYQSLYPDMCVEAPVLYRDMPKTVYLSFDDGPSSVTEKNLDILKEKQVPATFFVTGANSEANPDILCRIVAEGHTLGIHTYSHKYDDIYASVEAYLEDFYKIWNYVYETTGEKPTVFRFAGGSINAYNRGIYQDIVAEMLRRGFTYYDWNVSSGDASKNITALQILHNVTDYIERHDSAVVLMHDREDNALTSSVLAEMIDSISASGYRFSRLRNDIRPVTFAYGY